jgi:hypothetical protein
MYHACMKHIAVDYHFIQEKVFNKDILACYTSTHHQPSNIFTKGMTKAGLLLLRDKLIVFSLPINLRGHVNNIATSLDKSPYSTKIRKSDHMLSCTSYLLD